MRIHDAYTKQDRAVKAEGPTAARDIVGRSKEASGATAAAGSPATHVTVSARAKELAANAGPSGARVEALRAEVHAGTFKVDAHAIAKRLVGDVGA